MASFGSFVTEREVYSDPVYTVYYARKHGDSSGEYAVKIFPLPARGSPAEVASGGDGRDGLERSRQSSIQVQETAAGISKCVASVLEKGSDPRGPWYATRFYPRSVNKMMRGKVALPRASLEHILRSIAQGALDMKRACGRSHGDIRPSNVQVSKTEKLTEAEVVLCDPLPGDTEQAARYELDDLHAVGLILLQLVRQRMISREDASLMLPISPGPEWTRIFGSDASDWLALCNRLLDGNLSIEHFNLEALVARLEELKPKAGSSKKLVLTAAIAFILLCTAGFWLLRPRLQLVEVTSDPPGATVLLDEKKLDGVTPLKLKLKPGNHFIIARQDEFGSEQATNLVVRNGPLDVYFEFPYGSIVLRSDPPGATIWRGGVSLGKTTREGPLFAVPHAPTGTVTFRLKLEGFEPTEVTGLVLSRHKLELAATLHPLAVAKSEQTPEPPKAAVKETTPDTAPQTVPDTAPPAVPLVGVVELWADPGPALILDRGGHEVGRASRDTMVSLTLAPGEYPFTARTEGLDDMAAAITVKEGETNRYTFVFDCGTVEWTQDAVPATVTSLGRSQTTPASFIQRTGVSTAYVVAAPGYRTVTNFVTVQKGERKSMPARLGPSPIYVALISDPPGAVFETENGTTLQPAVANKSLYLLEPRSTTLVARYAGLGAITNRVALTPQSNGVPVNFKFDYGVLTLSNLPPDIAVYEGDTPVTPTGPEKWVYQKPGAHTYALRGRSGSQTLSTNISPGLNILRWATAERTWKNSLGMWFAWVPHLPGGGNWPGQNEPGGWVGISETTQGQYKKMDGSNPSYFQEGDNYPVENLTWDQAMNFCRWLSSHDAAERPGWRYALPTDEQFAAFAADADSLPRVTNEGRASSSMDDAFSLQRGARIPAAANLNAARSHSEQVGSTKRPNQYGLYDVVGNVWEWLARPPGKESFYAGGSYLNFSSQTVTAKAKERTLKKGPNVGFRIVLVPAE